jgi:hypothetical protein
MTFKKDYINYVFHSVLNGTERYRRDDRLKALVARIIATDDIVKLTYIVGKTAGLELLFKYLLYISDKIDKSQITVFNLRDNFDYDVANLCKLFEKLLDYQGGSLNKKIESLESEKKESELPVETPKTEVPKDRIKIEISEGSEVISTTDEMIQTDEEVTEDENAPALTLIENTGDGQKEAEVFELSDINEDIETTVEETADEEATEKETVEASDEEELAEKESDDIIVEEENAETEEETEKETDDKKDKSEAPRKEIEIPLDEPYPVLEIEVRKPVRDYEESEEVVKEESVTNEAYFKFESKFFEEVKILEKLFATVEKESRISGEEKASEKCLQCLTEIIEMTSELADLSRQLSFDLIADIFITMNLYFTKAISSTEIISSERIRLLDSSLSLVSSLIKGEDYLNYDVIVDKIEMLKSEMQRPVEVIEEFTVKPVSPAEPQETEPAQEEQEPEESPDEKPLPEHSMKQSELESVNFKMRYLVKEFEKSFQSIGNMKGEYKRFDALEKIDELNNALRLIAKISSAVKMKDILKLAEVAYVFLKYLKDYRMDLMDPEIQQIVKYIIFTFKMLLTDRKPEDFNVLVQYLNNPVKIFADS